MTAEAKKSLFPKIRKFFEIDNKERGKERERKKAEAQPRHKKGRRV